MANISDVALFEAIYLLATDDPVEGGPNGISNRQGQQLANRTKWLKDKIDSVGLTDAVEFNGDMIALKKTGFYIVASTATNKPSGSGGYCLVIARDSLSSNSQNSYMHLFLTNDGFLYTRSYVNNAANPLAPTWVQFNRKADLDEIKGGMIGGVMGFAYVIAPDGSNRPSGWLECNGQAVSRNAYNDLFAKIGVNYGAGDGVNTFNLPNIPDASSANGSLVYLIKF